MTGEALDLLLVEDNPNDVELTLHVLKKHNLANRIKVMRDGAEALEYIFGGADGSPDGPVPSVILLDLKLPKIGGIEVLGRLKADQRTRRIPVVVLTSSREDRDLLLCYDLGVNSYIVKPVDFAQFNGAVLQLGRYWMLLNERPPFASEP